MLGQGALASPSLRVERSVDSGDGFAFVERGAAFTHGKMELDLAMGSGIYRQQTCIRDERGQR